VSGSVGMVSYHGGDLVYFRTAFLDDADPCYVKRDGQYVAYLGQEYRLVARLPNYMGDGEEWWQAERLGDLP